MPRKLDRAWPHTGRTSMAASVLTEAKLAVWLGRACSDAPASLAASTKYQGTASRRGALGDLNWPPVNGPAGDSSGLMSSESESRHGTLPPRANRRGHGRCWPDIRLGRRPSEQKTWKSTGGASHRFLSLAIVFLAPSFPGYVTLRLFTLPRCPFFFIFPPGGISPRAMAHCKWQSARE